MASSFDKYILFRPDVNSGERDRSGVAGSNVIEHQISDSERSANSVSKPLPGSCTGSVQIKKTGRRSSSLIK